MPEDKYKKLIDNLKQMIEIMEYDGMRSPGKIKMNSGNLVDMYNLLDRYQAEVTKSSTPKPVATKPATTVSKKSN